MRNFVSFHKKWYRVVPWSFQLFPQLLSCVYITLSTFLCRLCYSFCNWYICLALPFIRRFIYNRVNFSLSFSLRASILSAQSFKTFSVSFLDTSRPKRPEEVHERDYYFVPLPSFEADIISHKFVEYGEFEGHYYGTALDSIRRVVNSGKYCILNLHCEVCHIILGAEIAKILLDSSPEQQSFLSRELQGAKKMGLAKTRGARNSKEHGEHGERESMWREKAWRARHPRFLMSRAFSRVTDIFHRLGGRYFFSCKLTGRPYVFSFSSFAHPCSWWLLSTCFDSFFLF